MPGTTAVYGFPYQELTDQPHGPDLGQDLAEAVEVEVARLDAVWVEGSRTVDAGNIAVGGDIEIEITVTGAVVGRQPLIGPPAAIEAGLSWCGYVSATGFVRVRLRNHTAGIINPANATWTASVRL